jgi:hypothetical protein
MRLPEDGFKRGPKRVATIKKQCEQFDWFILLLFFIVVLTAKSHQS